MAFDLIDYLTRLGEDPAFRTAWLEEPDHTFAGYGLTAEEQGVLRERDGRLRALLERWPGRTALPELHFALTVAPRVTTPNAGPPQIGHLASLSPWPQQPTTSAPSASTNPASAPTNTWHHATDTSAVADAVSEARGASGDERYPALLTLCRALTGVT